jgi:hypothetical protein
MPKKSWVEKAAESGDWTADQKKAAKALRVAAANRNRTGIAVTDDAAFEQYHDDSGDDDGGEVELVEETDTDTVHHHVIVRTEPKVAPPVADLVPRLPAGLKSYPDSEPSFAEQYPHYSRARVRGFRDRLLAAQRSTERYRRAMVEHREHLAATLPEPVEKPYGQWGSPRPTGKPLTGKARWEKPKHVSGVPPAPVRRKQWLGKHRDVLERLGRPTKPDKPSDAAKQKAYRDRKRATARRPRPSLKLKLRRRNRPAQT